MSAMKGNKDYLCALQESSDAAALVSATLALAYEQRTANLIAYVDKIDDTAAAIPVVNEIKSRLGIAKKED